MENTDQEIVNDLEQTNVEEEKEQDVAELPS